MEIIHLVLGKANPNRMNGVNKVVFQLATEQCKMGRNVSVWGITKNTTHDYGNRNFNTLLFPAEQNTFKISRTLRLAIKEAKNRNTVFHIHGGWVPTFYSISSILKKHKIPFVFTPHGSYNSIAMKKNKWVKKIYFELFEKKLLKRTQKIHCIGKSEIEGLSNIFKTSKTFLMPYGYKNVSDTRKDFPREESKFIIGFIGRLDIHTKGLDLLIEAFNKFQEKRKNSELWIVGDSEQRSQLQNTINSNKLQDKVILWGKKFGDDKNNLLQKMHAFAHPSRNEGLPSAVLEAASFGVPCIVSEATNVGAFVKKHECGIVVSNENSEEITDALLALDNKRENKVLHKLGDKARAMVDTEFNWNHLVIEFDNLYNN